MQIKHKNTQKKNIEQRRFVRILRMAYMLSFLLIFTFFPSAMIAKNSDDVSPDLFAQADIDRRYPNLALNRASSPDPDPGTAGLDSVNFNYNERTDFVLKSNWYLKPSFYVNYYNLGPDIQRAFDQISGLFSGDKLPMKIATKTTVLQINAAKPVERAPTNVLPTGNFGGGIIFGKHRIEVDMGLAGVVPLNTADVDTTAIMSEQCSGALADCPLARLGFVDETTRKAEYNFKFVINERVWILAPTVTYDWTFKEESWGSLGVGGSLGVVILMAVQNVEFQAKRKDVSATGLDSRILEGAATSTAMSDWGPQVRLFMSYRRKIMGFENDFRLGLSYGWVALDRNVDGIGQAMIGNQMAASFPMSAIGIKNREDNKFELIGVYLQAGVLF